MLSPIPVTVKYLTNDKVFNTDFDIYAILLESIKIVREPDKTEYRYGELLNHSGLIVHAVYNNEEEEDITGQCNVVPATASQFKGEYEAEVSYLGLTDFFSLQIIQPLRIEVTKNPKQVKYKSGAKISYSGIEITCFYADGSTADVTDECTFDVDEGSTIDSNMTVEIAYTEGDRTAYTNLSLETKRVVGIKIDRTHSKKTDIYVNDGIDFSDIKIVAEYDDGSTELIDCDFSGTETNEDTGEQETYPISSGDKLKKSKTKLEASYTAPTPESGQQTFTIPLNEPVIEKIEPINSFVAPKIEAGTDIDYPVFTLGYTQMGTLVKRTFVQGTLIPWYITYGRMCEDSYTEDAYGEKIGYWMEYRMIPDTTMDLWFIDPATGKRVVNYNFKKVQFKFNDTIPTAPARQPETDSFSVWGWNTNSYDDFINGRKGSPEIIYAMGPVYYDSVPTRRVTAIKPVLKNGQFVWEVTTDSVGNNTEGETTVTVPVDDIDMPEGTLDWLKLADSPSKLIECNQNTATFEFVSNGETHRAELDISRFIPSSEYNRCTGIYTWGNVTSEARNSQTESNATEILHVARFSSDNDAKNDVYIVFKTIYETPLVETVGLKNISVDDRVTYNLGDTVDYDSLRIIAEYTNGKKESISPKDVSFKLPSDTVIAIDMDTENTVKYTNEAGESVEVNYDLKYHKLLRLNVTPPTKLRYEMYESFDYTGFQAIVEYTDGKTKDVTDLVKISTKSAFYVTPETESKVKVTYTEGRDSVVAEYELQLVYIGMWIQKQPTKRLYRVGETLDYTGLKIVKNNSVTDKDQCEFSVPEGTEVTPTTDERIIVTFVQAGKSFSTSFDIFIVDKDYTKKIDHIEIAHLPLKTNYINGDLIKYDGIRVICCYEDGSTQNVTGLVKYNVKPNSIVTSETPEKIELTYSEEYSGSFSQTFDIHIEIFDRLEVTPPKDVQFRLSDRLKLGATRAVCYYKNRPDFKQDVSDRLEFSPAQGTIITKDMSDSITVTYNEGLYSVSSSFNVELIKVQQLTVTGAPQTQYLYGDILDLSNVRVSCQYLDGTIEDVTKSASFSPSNGDAITPSDSSVKVSYLDGETIFPLNVVAKNRFNIQMPEKTEYVLGESLDFTGLKLLYNTPSTTNENVTQRASYVPPEGTIINAQAVSAGRQEVMFLYNGYYGYFSVNVLKARLDITPPIKQVYRTGETLNLIGFSAYYNDGEKTRISVEDLVFEPSRDTPLTSDIISVQISYSVGDDDVLTGSFEITVKEEEDA